MGSRNCIIGATGYIGKNLAYFLNEKGESISCYDLSDTGSEPWMNHRALDMTDLEAVRELDLDYDFIYFFAGLTGCWLYAGIYLVSIKSIQVLYFLK